jgi:uncharacterized protein
MIERNDYPAGVPCWIDLMQPDLDATMAFYRDLFGWSYEVRTPQGAPQRYAYARLEGLTVGGVGGPPQGDPSGWTQYIAVASADHTTDAVVGAGGRVVNGPVDIPNSGRVAVCADDAGAVFGVWEGRELRGAQLVNAAGSWGFSTLHTADADVSRRFYGAVFGWECDVFDMGGGQKGGLWRLPGYGDFLAQRDPEIRERQAGAQAPGGFADAVAILSPEPDSGTEPARWSITFNVANADAAFEHATQLDAKIVTPLFDTTYTRMGTIQDPQGAVLTLSEYRPPDAG